MNTGINLVLSLKRWGPMCCLGLFIVLTLAADVWPARKYYFYTEIPGMEAFFRLENLAFMAPSPVAGSIMHHESLVYLLLLKVVHAFVPDRLLCMRLLSISAGTATLIFLYLIGKSLLSRTAALVAIYFLVTDPAFLETARAYGYHSLSHMVSLLAVLLAVLANRQQQWWWGVSFSAFACYLLLYLYAPLRLVTIPLVMVWYVFSGRGWWRKTLFFCGVFGILVTAIGVLQQGKSSILSQVLQTEGWGEYAQSKHTALDISRFLEHLKRHFPVLLGYLFNWKRTAFATGVTTSRIFNSGYLPFWIIGLIICGLRRRRGQVMALLLLAFFALPPLGSDLLRPSRIIFVLYPIALLVGLGVTSGYSYLARAASGKSWSRVVPAVFYAFLLMIGLLDIRHFLFELSRTQPAVSSENLSMIADFILERGGRNARVVFPQDCHPYFLGNKYIANKVTRDYQLWSIDSRKLMNVIYLTLTDDRPFLAVFHPPPPDGFAGAIAWAKEHFPESVSISRIPDTEFQVFAFTPPPSISPNLLASEGPEVRSSAGGTGAELNDFADGDPTTWVEISPLREGETPWVTFDFGSNNERTVRVILASPADVPARPEFIREAIVSGSMDGEDWEILSRIKGEKTPRPGTWYQWTFPGERPLRYYRLEFYGDNGRPAQSVAIGELGLFESERHLISVFKLGDMVAL